MTSGPSVGYRAGVVWAVSAIVVIGLGLPLAAWLLTLGAARRPPAPLSSRYGRTDRWLHERYGLDWRACTQVRAAVAAGQRVSDPALESAAHGFADLMVRSQAPGQRLLIISGYIGIAAGLGLAILGIVGVTGHHDGNPAAVFDIPWGILLAANGWVQLIYRARQQRRKAARALELNQPGSSLAAGLS